MTAATQRKARTRASRPAYLTLHGWALGTLIEHGAVIECPDHGHHLDRADPDAWNRAREEAGTLSQAQPRARKWSELEFLPVFKG
jgi:hypothetical protein